MAERKQEWTRAQLRSRYDSLRQDGFTPEEAWDIALWFHPLDHWVIRQLRQDRRQLLRNWTEAGLSEEEIAERLERRYMDLGVKGQYEDEEWYIARAGV